MNVDLINFLNRTPIVSIIIFAISSFVCYGMSSLFGGYFPKLVKLSKGSFITLEKNTWNSAVLNRIVQWRLQDGAKLDDDLRNEILEKYGPQKGKHFKNVIKTENK